MVTTSLAAGAVHQETEWVRPGCSSVIIRECLPKNITKSPHARAADNRFEAVGGRKLLPPGADGLIGMASGSFQATSFLFRRPSGPQCPESEADRTPEVSIARRTLAGCIERVAIPFTGNYKDAPSADV